MAPQSQLLTLIQGQQQAPDTAQLQRTLVTLQKKEQFAKKTLYESQIKWTNFSSDIVRVCNELIQALEEKQVTNYVIHTNMPQQPQLVRSLPHIKDKIQKYDAFLQNNKHELDSKEYAQSLGLLD
jgi:hypothetical protein